MVHNAFFNGAECQMQMRGNATVCALPRDAGTVRRARTTRHDTCYLNRLGSQPIRHVVRRNTSEDLSRGLWSARVALKNNRHFPVKQQVSFVFAKQISNRSREPLSRDERAAVTSQPGHGTAAECVSGPPSHPRTRWTHCECIQEVRNREGFLYLYRGQGCWKRYGGFIAYRT